MKVEYFIVGLLAILSFLNFIIYRKKPNIIKMTFGLLLSLSYLAFVFIPVLAGYVWVYDIVTLSYTLFLSITFVPKKITQNLTEYDYYELEKSYDDMKDEKEKLRERYLSTISLVDEGVIFYENNFNDVILSDRAHEIFGGAASLPMSDHVLSVDSLDRVDYQKAIERVSQKVAAYEVKYRVTRDNRTFWVLERGHFIDVSGKKSIIAVVRPLDVSVYKETSYFDVDSLYTEEKMYPIISDLISSHRPFSLVYFELSNIPDINKNYGRAVGNLMMNDCIRYLKSNYAKDINRMFRIAGIRFVMIIDDMRAYEDFHKALLSNGSMIYNIKIQIAGIKDVVKPNFGVVNYSGSKIIPSDELVKLAERTLEQAIEATRRNYSIFGE